MPALQKREVAILGNKYAIYSINIFKNVMVDQLIKDHIPSANFKALKANCLVRSKFSEYKNYNIFKRLVSNFQVKGWDFNLCVLFGTLPLTSINQASRKNLENWQKGASIKFPPFPSSQNVSLPCPETLSPVTQAISSLLPHVGDPPAQCRAERFL